MLAVLLLVGLKFPIFTAALGLGWLDQPLWLVTAPVPKAGRAAIRASCFICSGTAR